MLYGSEGKKATFLFREQVIRYFNEHPNEIVSLGDIVDATGLSRANVANCVTRMRASLPILLVGRGLYRYTTDDYSIEGPSDATTPPQSELFELLTKLPDGRLLLKDEDGVAYFASKV